MMFWFVQNYSKIDTVWLLGIRAKIITYVILWRGLSEQLIAQLDVIVLDATQWAELPTIDNMFSRNGEKEKLIATWMMAQFLQFL